MQKWSMDVQVSSAKVLKEIFIYGQNIQNIINRDVCKTDFKKAFAMSQTPITAFNDG